MAREQFLSASVLNLLPLPQSGLFTPETRAQLVGVVARAATSPPHGVLLDILTPLQATGLDVEGNTQHWWARLAEAATERTQPHWLDRFATQEDWDTHCVTPVNAAWGGYLRSDRLTRRGYSGATAKRKHDRRLQQSYTRAVEDWNYAFRDEGEKFYEQLTLYAKHYSKSSQEFLSLMGLHIRDWLGAIGLHITLLCGNPNAINWLGHTSKLVALTFPDPPFVPIHFRQSLVHELMATLGRDLYLQLPQPPLEVLNAKLDVTMGSYLHRAYGEPPLSFMHVEVVDGTLSLHTRILGDFPLAPPQVEDWLRPLRQPVAPPGFVVLMEDLFAYTASGDRPLGYLFITLVRLPLSILPPQLLLHRSDSGVPDTPFDYRLPWTLFVPMPPLGTTWQLIYRIPVAPYQPISGAIEGVYYAVDTLGQPSNVAVWRVAGTAPIVLQHVIGEDPPAGLNWRLTVVEDVLSRATPGEAPLATVTFSFEAQAPPAWPWEVWLVRSDGGVPDVQLTPTAGIAQVLDVPPAGVRWSLEVRGTRLTALLFNVVYVGYWWVEDEAGFESNHAVWSITFFATT